MIINTELGSVEVSNEIVNGFGHRMGTNVRQEIERIVRYSVQACVNHPGNVAYRLAISKLAGEYIQAVTQTL